MKIVFSIVLLFFWSSIGAQVRPEYSGMWYPPTQSGHGLSLEVLDRHRSAGFWYLYDRYGKPFWLLLEGYNVENRMELTAYYYEGMVMDEWDPDTNNVTVWGHVTVEFHDCMHATVKVTRDTFHGTINSYMSDMTRLTHIAGLECSGEPADLPPPNPGSMEFFTEHEWNMLSPHSNTRISGIQIAPDGTFTVSGYFDCEILFQVKTDWTGNSFEITYAPTDDECTLPESDDPVTLFGELYEDHEVCYWNGTQNVCERMQEVVHFGYYKWNACDLHLDEELVFWRNPYPDP